MSEKQIKPDWQARIVNMRKTIKALGDESCIPPEYMLEALDEIERLQSLTRWVPATESLPEIGEVVQWSHVGWKHVKEGYLTASGILKVWFGEYRKIDNMKWTRLLPPEGVK